VPAAVARAGGGEFAPKISSSCCAARSGGEECVRRSDGYSQRAIVEPSHIEIKVLPIATATPSTSASANDFVPCAGISEGDEEAPSPAVRPNCAERWADRGRRRGRRSRYEGAGTRVSARPRRQILLQGDEHPAAGRDTQGRKRSPGSTLSTLQCASLPGAVQIGRPSDVRGHAIEVRVSEDADTSFMPQSGTWHDVGRLPRAGTARGRGTSRRPARSASGSTEAMRQLQVDKGRAQVIDSVHWGDRRSPGC